MLGDSIKKFALSQAFSYIEKDPIKNLTHVMDMVDKFAGDGPSPSPVSARPSVTPSTTKTPPPTSWCFV